MAQQQSSRLNRLLTLLDTGSTQATRFTAARQIGDIAKSHPQDLNSLLRKVCQYLHSKNWDTRVAAAHAIGAIAHNVKHTSVSEVLSCVEAKMREAGISENIGNTVCPNYDPKGAAIGSFRRFFDINKVLEFGALLASGGQEYDIAVDNSKNPKERLARQKQNLKRRLGLDVCEQFMDVSDVFRDEDLIVPKGHDHVTSFNNRLYIPASANNFQQFVSRMVPNVVSKRRPSAREMNLLKRKAKINSKDQTKGWSDEGDTELSGAHSSSTPRGGCSHPLSSNKLDAIVDDDSEVDRDGRWPFLSFVEQLILDMFDSAWEVRHGSIMALREILTHHGASAGVYKPEVTTDSSLLDVLKEVDDPSPVKREQGLDLSMQGSGEVLEPNLKKPKIEDTSIPVISIMGSADQHVCFDQHVKMEDVKYILHSGQLNGDVHSSSLEIEAKPFDDSILCQSKEADNVKESMGTFSNHVAKSNSELITLLKLARTSWLKNCEFLQDCAIRFLCILSLDRFGDYVSDQVVAPVRETCAQALGAVFKYMHPSMVYETLDILLKMQRRPEWEIRHGSLLGIKYLVAVRHEMMHHLLGAVLPACKTGLEDPDDDVRAAAADALIPAASCIVALKGQSLHSIVMLLWDILLDLDDLSPSTSSVMNLLAEIYSQEMMPNTSGAAMSNEDQNFDLNELTSCDNPGGVQDTQENPYMLSILAPRLWPFMRHSIRSVRHSAIRTLERLLQAGHRKSLSEPSGSAFWPSFILGDTLRIVFQNLLLESNEEILQCSERVWRLLVQCPVRDLEACAVSYMSSWIELATTPLGSALDATKMFWPVAIPRKSQHRAAAKMKAARLENEISANASLDYARGPMPQEKYGDTFSASVKIIFGADTDMSVHYTRVVTASALGILSSRLSQSSLHYVINPIWDALTSMSGVQRQVASLVLISWFKEIKGLECFQTQKKIPVVPELLKTWLLDLLSCADPAFPTKDSSISYSELLRHYAKMRHQAEQMVNAVKSSGKFPELLSANTINLESLSVDDAISFASNLPTPSNTESHGLMNKHLIDDVESAKQHLISTSSILTLTQTNLHVTVTSLVAAAVVWMSELPAKLNPIILPLMASIRREQEEVLQQKSAEALAELIYDCISRRPGPNDKLIKNICGLTCADPSETPQANVISSLEKIDDQDFLSFGPSTGRRSRVHGVGGGEDRSRNEGFISRRGSEFVLKKLCQKFCGSLFDRLPKLWDCLIEVLKPAGASDEQQISVAIKSVKDPQVLINNIQVVRSIAPMLDEVLKPRLLTLLPCVFECVRHSHVAVRLAASRCITSMAKSISNDVMRAVIENGIPMLGDVTSVNARQGAGMLVSLLVQGLGVELVPYAPLLVVPLLRCMSDSDSSVRQSVTRSFAALVPLLPLARGLPTPPGLSEDVSKNSEDAKFLEQLLDNSHIDDYKLSAELKVNLRRYQQEGINWLAFLKRFKLHGILCDDMGLGKTLQASAIVASDIAERQISSSSGTLHPSLIVCPSTLVGHWAFEIEKYIDVSIISTLQYVGSAPERMTLRESFYKHNIIITSYDVVRKDIDILGQLLWNYCILDEGHIIKNTKSKITVAIKQLKAEHRLILSGTPIQNNIMDLWSLFDYLMPGFLGTERQFQATYGKPLLAARDPKCSAKDAEAGALAMEALHKQVMPFLLRRTKDEVLSDLPEKIIQDRYCDLSPVQLKLYEQFSGSQVKQEISSMVTLDESNVSAGAAASPKASTHVFQALQYLLKLCSHPLLVVGDRMPDSLKSQLSELLNPGSDVVSELRKLHHSPKLVALQEILEECGIGVDSSASDDTITVGQHRVLIFAQHKALLDIIEKDLFRNHMKSVTYLRLDGSVEPEKRFDIVKAFNSDPTIDALLLTTHVGGLGLNLTSADTLVFMEHDWNPMRDHQAMDRAHRLGQKKVVHVHRLIMRGTLEEKVMNLQKFKVSIANAVINSENASLKTMNTDQLLDLFATAETSKKGGTSLTRSDGSAGRDPKLMGTGKGLKAILGGLEELWDQSQYSEEYNLSQFLAKLNG